MTIDPQLAANEEQQRQQQPLADIVGSVGEGAITGSDVVGAVLRNLPTAAAPADAGTLASTAEAAAGISDAAEAGGGILEALGGLFSF